MEDPHQQDSDVTPEEPADDLPQEFVGDLFGDDYAPADFPGWNDEDSENGAP